MFNKVVGIIKLVYDIMMTFCVSLNMATLVCGQLRVIVSGETPSNVVILGITGLITCLVIWGVILQLDVKIIMKAWDK